MQIILRKQVEKLGHAGEVKDVSAGHFRNFLFPRGLAEPATPAGLKRAEGMRAQAALQLTKDKEVFTAFLQKLEKEYIVLLRKANEEGHLFGSVTEEDVAEALSQKGYQIEKDRIQMEIHIKELGTYPIVLKSHDISGSISVTVERD